MKTMSQFSSKEEMLNSILSTMDIPDNRRDINDVGNLSWMTRNLQCRNREHEDFGRAMSLVKEIFKSKI